MTNKIEKLFQLDGRVIVITGAAGLLGKMHADAVAAYGGIPILLDISVSEAKKTANELNSKYNSSAIGMSVDITNENEVEKNLEEILLEFGRIDGLVNNAANNPKIESNSKKNFSRLENFPLQAWYEDINVGLTGAFICSKHYGGAIAKNKRGGSIINISSDLGLIAPDQRLYKKNGIPNDLQAVKPVTYSVVKSGLIGLTRYLSTYWPENNVRCNAMCPGGIENNQPSQFLKEVSSRIPLNRLANVTEYQGTLIWMLSDASSYLNGSIIAIDGGRTAW
jgi:NAD(P)-dependent dehydrogenase (short-subunit alcohol dehydrogenase family)